MTPIECKVMLDAFQATFGKVYSQAARDRIFERVQKVPSKFVQAIIEDIEEMDKHPGNMGNTILAAWRNLDKAGAAEERKLGCPDCRDGVIWYRRGDQGYATNCATCQPYAAPQYKATAAQLRAAGFEITNPKRGTHELTPQQISVMRARLSSMGFGLSEYGADRAAA